MKTKKEHVGFLACGQTHLECVGQKRNRFPPLFEGFCDHPDLGKLEALELKQLCVVVVQRIDGQLVSEALQIGGGHMVKALQGPGHLSGWPQQGQVELTAGEHTTVPRLYAGNGPNFAGHSVPNGLKAQQQCPTRVADFLSLLARREDPVRAPLYLAVVGE